MSLPSSVDVAIIGAGAAGLGAANALKNSGLSVLVLEARDRVGGRAHTIMASPDVTFDVGCGWLHSADQNSFVKIAEQLGFEINRSLPPWRERAYGKAFPQDDRDEFIRALDAFYDRAEQAAKEAERSGRDGPANLCLEPGNRWNPMIDAISTYINGCELDQVSLLDMDAYEDTDLNWRVRRGYGALIAAYGATCPLALNCEVTLIDHSAKRVRIETSQGTLTADKVIVTVPTNLIADEAIRFHPPLPAKVDAARGLPLGLADKVTLALDEPEALPKEGNLRAATMRTAMGTYHIRPFGQPCIEGFFGGRFAQSLEDAGPGALAAESINEIVSILGNDFRRKLKPLAESRWAHDPFARGSYSHALPGHAGDRAVLAAPVDGRLFFAGEATSPEFFSTAHGARDSGERAAEEVIGFAREQIAYVPGSAARGEHRILEGVILGLEIDVIGGRIGWLRLTGQRDDDDLVLPVDIERLAREADGNHRTVWINPPAIAVSRRPVAIGVGAKGKCRTSCMFDPVRREYSRAVNDAVAQKEDAEAAEIPQRYPRAAASDLLPGFGFQRIECVKLHAEAGPDRLGHVVGQGFSCGRRYQAAEDIGIAGIVVELTAGPMFGFQTPHQRQNASRNLVTKRFAVTINV